MNLAEYRKLAQSALFASCLETFRSKADNNGCLEARKAVLDLLSAHNETLPEKMTYDTIKESVVMVAAAYDFEASFGQTFFGSIARPLVLRGLSVCPAYPKAKQVHTQLVPTPLTMQSNDPAQINGWGLREPNANVIIYAEQKLGSPLFLDKDGDISLIEKYERETGKKFPHTLLVHSSTAANGTPKGHWYFQQTPRTIALENNISEHKTGGLFSLRVKNYYVVSIGSIHPTTGLPYAIGVDAPIIPMPDDFLDWLLSLVKDEPKTREEAQQRKFGKGERYPALISELGHMLNRGYSREMIITNGLAWAREFFDVPADAFNEKLVQGEIEHFVDHGYKSGQPLGGDLILNQKPDPGSPAAAQQEAQQKTAESGIEIFGDATAEPAVIDAQSYPKFPQYVWAGTSIYENFVKPMCAQNSRIDYFMWLSAMVLQMNYLGTKIKLKFQFTTNALNLGIYLILIGKRGETHKSEIANDAMEYFKYTGCLTHNGGGLKTADGRSVVWTAGSMEGVGIEAQKTNCKNIVLFYDELETLVKKASITSSSMNANILTMAESKKFGNTIKSAKETYSLEPGTYVTTLFVCTTPPRFNTFWPEMGAKDSGLDDRCTFVLQPEELPKKSMFVPVNILETSHKTRMLIDKAIIQGEFAIENELNPKYQQLIADATSREAIRALKWALAIAVDLGLTSIDDECLERGVDIVRYEMAVKEMMRVFGSADPQAVIQNKITTLLFSAGGRMSEENFYRRAGKLTHGTGYWEHAFQGLMKGSYIRIERNRTKGTSEVVLLKRYILERGGKDDE